MFKTKCATAMALPSMSLSALAAETTYDFDSLSKIYYSSNAGGQLTGILVNDTVPVTKTIHSAQVDQRCDAFATEMIKNPGVYIFSITLDEVVAGTGFRYTLTHCALERKP